MREIRVLVFPCGSEIGLELYRSLRYSKDIELFGASSVPDHGRFIYRKYIGGIPFISDPAFLTRVNSIVNEYQISYILPAHDSVVLHLAESWNSGDLDCPVVTSPIETCRILRSKKKTMELFYNVVRTPHVYDDIDKIDTYPVFLKPDVGQGSRGTAIARNKSDAMFYLSKCPDLLLMEYLPGEEYTVDCYTNNNGKLLFCGARKRCRISNGISVNTKPITDDRIRMIAEKINIHLAVRGMWFFQLIKTKSGDYALTEIAPRIAGTMGMYRNLGVNFPLLNIYEFEGYPVEIKTNSYDIEMDRALFSRFKLGLAYKHAYVDFDDCLIINGKINVNLICFLYQCVNDGVKIHLLTRHRCDINRSLARYRLEGVFDSIIKLKLGEKKSTYINQNDSIFIDDSFSERAEVQKSLAIPVFAPDAIESLLK